MMNPDLIRGARAQVEKIADLASMSARGGQALGSAVGRTFGAHTGNVLKYAPAAIGALGGAAVGARRFDLPSDGEEKPTKMQRLKGALVGGAVGGTAGHLLGEGKKRKQAYEALMQLKPTEGMSSRAAQFRPTGDVHQDAARAAGLRLRAEFKRPAQAVQDLPGKAKALAHKWYGHAKQTVSDPTVSAMNIAASAVHPIEEGLRHPVELAKRVGSGALHPLGALGLAQSGLGAVHDFRTTEDPEGRKRGLAERTLSSTGNLAGGLAYGHYSGPASEDNPLTRMIGSHVGGKAVAAGTSRIGRGIDSLALGIRRKRDTAPTPDEQAGAGR